MDQVIKGERERKNTEILTLRGRKEEEESEKNKQPPQQTMTETSEM